MTRPPCPSELDLSRALRGTVDPVLTSHLATCTRCRAIWTGLERTVRLARDLPVNIPSAAHREEVRAALLAAAGMSPVREARAIPRRVAWAAGLALSLSLVAAVFLIVGASTRSRAPRAHATVHARSRTADFVLASPPPDELVKLRDGTISLDVEPLGPKERFRVLVGADEIEVRGTSFEVTAEAEQLIQVSVTRGHVNVVHRGESQLLGPGQSWRAPRSPAPKATVTPAIEATMLATPVAEPAKSHPARTVAVSGHRAQAPKQARRSEETEFDDAWDAMRAGNFRDAAEGFGDVVTRSPAGALADEGAFWRAVALGRAGSVVAAMAAFREAINRYPSSPRRGEAAAILGWLLVDAHHRDEAEQFFRLAEQDPSAAVQASARRGLTISGQ
ncbi:MAG TPA: FecR domain-containing protein [Polyangia bacterium]|jgi:TolA-binding protein